MFNDQYPVKISPDFITFEFISEGPKGEIVKYVEFKEVSDGIYNLGFGDKDNLTGIANDLIVTNNGDSKKVLVTVAATLSAFMDRYPNAIVFAQGSTKARTRLYQMGISNNLVMIKEDFIIMGLNKINEWEDFRVNVTYDAFLIKRKL